MGDGGTDRSRSKSSKSKSSKKSKKSSSKSKKRSKKERKYFSSDSESETDYLGKRKKLGQSDEIYHDKRSRDSSNNNSDCVGPKLPVQKSFSGPELPAHLRKPVVAGPQLPAHLQNVPKKIAGPQLPDHLQVQSKSNPKSLVVGPQLPPHLQQETTKQTTGPQLPDYLVGSNVHSSQDALYDDDDDDGDMIGPLASERQVTQTMSLEKRIKEINDRGKAMKEKLEAPPEAQSRENWMLELPEISSLSSNESLKARTFTAGKKATQDSSWTTAPKRKGQKEEPQKPKREYIVPKKQKQEQIKRYVEEFNNQKNRSQTLLEMHQAKQKEEETGKPASRKAFTRDEMMHRRPVNEGEYHKMLDSHGSLGDKFAPSSSKFI